MSRVTLLTHPWPKSGLGLILPEDSRLPLKEIARLAEQAGYQSLVDPGSVVSDDEDLDTQLTVESLRPNS